MGLISWGTWPLFVQQNLCEFASSREGQSSVKADVQFFGYSECDNR